MFLRWRARQSDPKIAAPQAMDDSLIPHYGDQWHIGVLYGPHGAPDFFTAESIEAFFATDWQVHYNSNRLGVRLSGPKPSWARADGGEAGLHPSNVHDCEYAIGAINFTGDFPVILTKDGPSLGGFVCPVTIAKAELWKVGQVKPGDKLRFHPIGFQQAQSLEQAQLGSIEALAAISAVTLPAPSLQPDTTVSATVLAELPAEGSRPRAVYRQAGDAYILLEYGDNVLDLALRLRVHLLMEALKAEPLRGLEELAPGVRSLQLRYDSRVLHQRTLLEHLLRLERQLGDVAELKVPTRIVHLPMAFEDSATLAAVERYRETVRSEAPWLPNNVDFIQRINGLSRREQVRAPSPPRAPWASAACTCASTAWTRRAVTNWWGARCRSGTNSSKTRSSPPVNPGCCASSIRCASTRSASKNWTSSAKRSVKGACRCASKRANSTSPPTPVSWPTTPGRSPTSSIASSRRSAPKWRAGAAMTTRPRRTSRPRQAAARESSKTTMEPP